MARKTSAIANCDRPLKKSQGSRNTTVAIMLVDAPGNLERQRHMLTHIPMQRYGYGVLGKRTESVLRNQLRVRSEPRHGRRGHKLHESLCTAEKSND